MRSTDKIVAGILVFCLAAGNTGCSLFKEKKISHEKFIEALEENDIEQTDDLEDIADAVITMYCEDGIYMTIDDEDDAQDFYDNVIDRVRDGYDCDVVETTYCYYAANGVTMIISAITMTDKKEARGFFEDTQDFLSDYDEDEDGSIDGYEYYICTDTSGDYLSAAGVYLEGDTVIYARCLDRNGEEFWLYDDILTDLELISPYEL